jgi:hypothetical protein
MELGVEVSTVTRARAGIISLARDLLSSVHFAC